MRSIVPSLLLFVIALSACSKNSNTPPKVMTHQDSVNAIVARLPKNFSGMYTKTDISYRNLGADTTYNYTYILTFYYDTVYHQTRVIDTYPQLATFTEDNETITFDFDRSISSSVFGHYVFYKLTDSLIWQIRDPGTIREFKGKKM